MIEPCESSTPKTSWPVSVCVSKWIRPIGPPRREAIARMSGSAIEWSPPRMIGSAPASTTWPTSASIAACVRTGSAGSTGASPKSTTFRTSIASMPASRCGPCGQLAARIARGPKRVPGRSETRSSVGAPTIATSTPPSSAASCV